MANYVSSECLPENGKIAIIIQTNQAYFMAYPAYNYANYKSDNRGDYV